MTIYRGPGGTGTATSDSDTTEFQEFVVDAQAARDAALAAQTAAELAETNAETAETNAETAETNAETAATNAASSASSAASSASSASSSASSASTSASNASSSASSASTSASAASSSASAASTSASNAATSATNAASSATAAASSATSASSSASTATTQATNAAASASAASTSASSASAAQTAAEAARDAALSAYDNFDDRYLGPKSSDPTLDNDGNALLTGALYFNTSSNVMKVYTGSSWVAAYVSAAGVLLTANNLSDVASTATSRTNLNVPTRTGGDASGTWGIDITGNAATATTATSATSATSATTATNVSGGTASVTSITDSGNLTFTGTGNRITGDFSNATLTSRASFQTSTTNGNTAVQAIPNGTATQTQFALYTDPAIANGNYGDLTLNNSEFRFRTNLLGTGTAVPMTFSTGGSERMRVDTSGNVGIGTSSPATKVHALTPSATAVGFRAGNSVSYAEFQVDASGNSQLIAPGGTQIFNTNGSERVRITSAGNVGIGTSSPTWKTTVVNGSTPRCLQLSQYATNNIDKYSFISAGHYTSSTYTDGFALIGGVGSSGANAVQIGGGIGETLASSVIQFYTAANNTTTVGTERGRFDSSGNFQFNSGYGSVATAYGCRAWVNFNGTGTVAIRGSGNVSSITDNGTGDYTLNFATAMPDANYAWQGGSWNSAGTGSGFVFINNSVASALATSSIRFRTGDSNTSYYDVAYITVSVFR